MDNCIFCKILKGEIPFYKVWEDEENYAFLSIHPIKEGHTLVIPKKHCEYLFDLEDSDYQSLMKASKTVAKLLKEAFDPKTGKIGVLVYGLDVPHVHIHLSPIDNPGDLSMSNAKPASAEELQQAQTKILSTTNH